ncbi:MAG: phosphoribosyltransferase [Vulcanimicrobiaceae bacterium]
MRQLIDEQVLRSRVSDMGAALSRAYAGKLPLFIGLLDSAAIFLADLTRAVTIPCEFDVMAVKPLDGPSGVRIDKDTAIPIEGRHVILVEDTYATGRTLRYVMQTLAARGPASLVACLLLGRREPRLVDIPFEYLGFEISDERVVGYGLDADGRYRELPSLYAYDASPV